MICIFFMLVFSTLSRADQVTVTHMHTQKIGMRVAYLGAAAERVASVIAADMACSGHYSIDTQEYRTIPSKKKEITALMQEGVLFLLILESHAKLSTHILSYRLYDTTTGMLISQASGKCFIDNDADSRYGHHIADQVWHTLMGYPSIFKTRIAYAKEVPYKKKGIAVKHICIAEYNGNNEQTLVATPTISIAPRWGGAPEAPFIFYSENTQTNIRLMAVDMRKKRATVTRRYDGESMYMTPNHDRSMHAFTASRGSGNTHIYLVRGNELEQCTFGEVADACPTFNHDSSVLYYCSDVKTGVPHIMAYTFKTKTHAFLPIKGYCVSPAYNPKRTLLAYSKMIDGFMQLCVFDTITLQEKQLTHDAAHHEDPTWSPCGTFLAYTHQVGTSSRIRIHCYATGYEQYVTPAGIHCSYPAWSYCTF